MKRTIQMYAFIKSGTTLPVVVSLLPGTGLAICKALGLGNRGRETPCTITYDDGRKPKRKRGEK